MNPILCYIILCKVRETDELNPVPVGPGERELCHRSINRMDQIFRFREGIASFWCRKHVCHFTVSIKCTQLYSYAP